MTIRYRVDTSGLKRRLSRSKRDRVTAARLATRNLGRDIAREAYKRAPTDTNRYQRAIAEAGNDLGAGLLRPPLQESKLSEKTRERVVQQVERAQAQVERWERNIASYERRGQRKSTKSFRDARKFLRRWEKNLQRALEYLEELDSAPEGAALAIGLFGSQRVTKSKNPARLSALTRIVSKVYGGKGRLFRVGPQFFCELHNKEPHASLVERNKRVMRRALNVAKRTFPNARHAGGRYLNDLRAAWRKAA